MPLPMPYSSICSPSHMRKTVPAVIVSTETNCQENCMPLAGLPASSRNWGLTSSLLRRKPHDIEPALSQAEKDGGVAGIFVDFLAPVSPSFCSFSKRRIDAGQELENNRGRDVGHDAQAENRGLAQLAAAEDRHLIEQIAAPPPPLVSKSFANFVVVEHRQRNVRSDAKNRQQEQREEDLLAQLGDRENDANFFPHGVSSASRVSAVWD